jgi:hypothetical protein
MRHAVGGVLLLLLALPAARAHAQTGDDKEPLSSKKRYDTLLKEFNRQQQEIIREAQKVKGAEQQKLLQKYQGLGKEYAEKFFKLAEDEPKSPVAVDALIWVVQNGSATPFYLKASDKLSAVVDEMPLKELSRRLQSLRLAASPTKLMESVYQRAEKDSQDPAAGDLLAWVATHGGISQVGKKATGKLVELFPDNPAIERLCQTLSLGRVPKADETLKQILEKSTKPRIKAVAALGIGKLLYAKTDTLGGNVDEANKVAAEAEKYLTEVVDKLAADNPALKAEAEKELKALRTLRVGKVAPEITAADLDEKEFKLSDYRGKVVLLDFWGNW